jgi:hypothetical protein
MRGDSVEKGDGENTHNYSSKSIIYLVYKYLPKNIARIKTGVIANKGAG